MSVPVNDLSYCRGKIGPWGSRASLAIQFASQKEKIPLTGIFALQNEWESVVTSEHASDLASIRLAWWEDQLETGRELSNHPVIRLLSLSGTFDVLPLTRLIQALRSYRALVLDAQPECELRASAILRESHGVFLHWTTLNRMNDIPDLPLCHLATASWLAQRLAALSLRTSGKVRTPQADILDAAREELRAGLDACAPFLRHPACRSIRIIAALTELEIHGFERSGNPTRPNAIPVKLWRAWHAARNEQRI